MLGFCGQVTVEGQSVLSCSSQESQIQISDSSTQQQAFLFMIIPKTDVFVWINLHMNQVLSK